MENQVSFECAVFHAEKRKDMSLAAFDASQEALEIETGLKTREKETMAAVCAETNGDGKAAYSNAEKREAEVSYRISIDLEYQEGLKKLSKVKGLAAVAQTNASFHADMVRIITAFAGGER